MFKIFNDKYIQWLNRKTFDGKRPIDIAAENGHLDIMGELEGNPPEEPDISALAHAAVRYKTGASIFFLRCQSFYFPKDILHAACRERHGHNSISALPITNNDLKKQDLDGFTPLMVAVKHRRYECVKTLIDTGEFDEEIIDIQDLNLKRTVLHICAEIKHEKITNILFDAIKDLNNIRNMLVQKDTMGDTPLHICAQEDNDHMCQKLLELYKTLPRSNPGRTPIWNLKNYNKLIPFQEAVRNNQLKTVKTMLDGIPNSKSRKDMIDATDDNLCTNLHIAALKGESTIYNNRIKKHIRVKYKQMLIRFLEKQRYSHTI